MSQALDSFQALMLLFHQTRAPHTVMMANPKPPGTNWLDLAGRVYNEVSAHHCYKSLLTRRAMPSALLITNLMAWKLVPWGDASKGLQTILDKRNAMVEKYMAKTGCSQAEAEAEVDDYMRDKDDYIKRKTAEEAAQKSKGGKKA
jgi:hypothetical protein